MEFPLIVTNFKAYDEGFGEDAVRMAKIHEKVSKETGVVIGVAVSAIDLKAIVEAVSIPVFVQHIDPITPGRGTGSVLPEAVKDIGAYGTLLNHSEKRLSREVLLASIKRAKEVGLRHIVCAESADEAEGFLEFEPEMLAVEPPELIGGDISVSTANPEIIDRTVEKIGRGKVIVGAGIKDARDVKIAFELGASGILLASGVMKSADPEAVLRDLVEGIKQAG
ncbi:triose-phosphate isomerase [Candidatus Peregrinibacteria bacterium]|nr:triose-phosphate isomerase [Candidatus Peregrinibacteria bacterium]